MRQGRCGGIKPVLVLALCFAALQTAVAQLSQNVGAFNPLSGQGAPPNVNASIQDELFPVNTWVLIASLLGVDEAAYNFDLNFYWILTWEDPRAEDIIMNTNYTTCNYYCSSRPSVSQNNYGQNACCDGVYVPQAESVNLVGFSAQTMPYRYSLNLLPGGALNYFVQVQGTWSCSFDYGAYPWDRHYLSVDIYTSFLPILSTPQSGAAYTSTDGYVIDSQGTAGLPSSIGAYRPSVTSLQLPGWAVGKTSANAMNFTNYVSTNAADFHEGSRTTSSGLAYFTPGIRFSIEINRITKGFYCIIVILPIALIVLFSFGIFSMSRTSLKARVNLLATQFLTLIILQFVLSSILPGSYSLIAPYYLILVSYVYTFLLFLVTISSNALLTQHKRREKKHMRRFCKNHFRQWSSNLYEQPVNNARQRRATMLEDQNGEAANGGDAVATAPLDGFLDEDADSFVTARGGQLDATPWKPSEHDYKWFERQQNRLYFKFYPLRRVVMFHKYIGMPESKEYVEYLSHKLESWARLVLLVLFLATTGIIFGVAASRTQSSADIHVFPSQDTIDLLKHTSGNS